MLRPQKRKYHEMYWEIAHAAAAQSEANRAKVGAVIVTPKGVISIGYNGLPSGMKGSCEWAIEDAKGYDTGKTRPEVIHAERNAIDKMTLSGISTEGAILFVTLAPCMECAKSIASVGITEVYYEKEYKTNVGIRFLTQMGIHVVKRS